MSASTSKAGNLSFVVDNGVAFSATLSVTLSGVVPDLSTYTAKMVISFGRSGSESEIILTDGSGITLSGATVTVALTAAQVTTITKNATYYLEVTSGSGRTERLIVGEFVVVPNAGV